MSKLSSIIIHGADSRTMPPFEPESKATARMCQNPKCSFVEERFPVGGEYSGARSANGETSSPSTEAQKSGNV
jgi:hypothetical protein